MGWDLGLGDELSHLVTNAPRQVPDKAVSLWDRRAVIQNPDPQIWIWGTWAKAGSPMASWVSHVYRKFNSNKEPCPASHKQEVTVAKSNTAPQRLLLTSRDVYVGGGSREITQLDSVTPQGREEGAQVRGASDVLGFKRRG